jgi:hypothetical protein
MVYKPTHNWRAPSCWNGLKLLMSRDVRFELLNFGNEDVVSWWFGTMEFYFSNQLGSS